MSDADIKRACKIVGVEPKMICPDMCWYENNNKGRMNAGLCMDFNHGKCLKLEARYPTGLDLLDRLKKGLVIMGCGFHIGWDTFHKCWCVIYMELNNKTIIFDDNWECTRGDTELEALVAAILEMGKEQ